MRTRRRIGKKKVYENLRKIVILLLAIIFFAILGIIIRYFTLPKNYDFELYAVTNLDALLIIKEQKQEDEEDPSIKKELVAQEYELEYKTIYETDDTLPKGMIQVKQEGRTGKVQVLVERTYKDLEIISEEEVSNKMLKVPIDKIVVTGTSKYKSNYKIKIGDTLYVTSNLLALRSDKDQNSEKVITINENDEVQLLEISGDWYKIAYNEYEGYVLSDTVTYIPPSNQYDGAEGLPREKLLATLSFNMNVNMPSGLSLEQFKEVLSNNERDVNKIIQLSAEYFYYAEKQYGVNGIFLAAVAIHESGWGTSAIAVNKKNLFGYGATDSNPYGNAYTYSNYSESIDLVARALVKYYLNPAGVRIYDGEIASGVYYNGNTVSAVNTMYASDKNWATKVYSYIKDLYNKL